MDGFVVKNGKELRYGYTTGSCATAVATAATEMLLSGELVTAVKIILPSGEVAIFQIDDIEMNREFVLCSVIKDGGDDPDATHGAKIFGKVTYKEQGIQIQGGQGVGVVTEKGLQISVGKPAINPVPRKMIMENAQRVIEKYEYTKGLEIQISVPRGEEIAKKTYNPRMGIVGGISILGTTGIVEPMSEKALIDTITAVIDKQYATDPNCILIAPGNYGKDFCREDLHLNIEKAVQISNFVGEALDYIKYKGFKKILFIGHTGKLIKVAAGVMNTHSAFADGRMEIIGVHSAISGADKDTVKAVMNCITTDDALDIIKDKPYYEEVINRILKKVMYHLNFRLNSEVEIEVVMYTNDRKHILKSEQADNLIQYFAEGNQ